jgi:DNA replication and repair protein RecF
MILEHISVLHYKNIEQADLDFSPKINYFLGKNAMGKTNLLDAIYYLSFCKSHSNPIDTQNISHNEEFALLQASYLFEEERRENFFCSIRRKQKKQFKRDKREYERLSEHIGVLPLVMVSPSDTELIAGGSESRRKFADIILSQFDKLYLQSLIRYNKALMQRNALLKSDQRIEESLFEIWEEQLALDGNFIYAKRKAFVEDFTPIFQQYYSRIAASDENIQFEYESQLKDSDLLTLLREKRNKDQILGYTSVGIHKDDLEMLIGEYSIKRVGSQGQNKTYLIALKLAQFDMMARMGYTTPILLLDDIFDKLDSHRVEQIIQIVSEEKFGQIFITDTNRKYLDDIIKRVNQNFHLYQVKEGEVERVKAEG